MPPTASMQQQRPWAHRTPSSDSIATTASMPLHPTTAPQPPLRKRHSNYLRGTERSTSPIPEMPPTRPPRNPARPHSIYPSSSSRPSTATSAKEDVTPWEVQTAAFGDDRARARSGAPSIKSKASSVGLGGASTGPVEEVTPWELYPVPATVPSNRATSTSSSVPHTPSASSPRFPLSSKPTGATEDVTPWELYPEPPSEITSPTQKPIFTESPQTSILAPPRSKPPSVISNGSSAIQRQSTATGPTEEVTPWELQIPPTPEEPTEKAHHPSKQRLSLTLSKAQLEDVMPWELHPAPPTPPLPASMRNGTHSNRVSVSSSRLSELGLRRRRSTGSRPSKFRPKPDQSRTPPRVNSSQAVSNNNFTEEPKSNAPSLLQNDTTWPLPPSGPPSSIPSASNSGAKDQNSQFSTADRAILEELKRNINARNAQFVLKGVGVHLTDGTVSSGKRHHPYPRHDVPYPRSYDREVVDMDVWETLFCQDICESLTWHVFDEPPLKVLDIGCGTGTWILNCARTWRETHFVGLDIVPLHPHLQQVGSEYAPRITWVQTNFLEGLPFPNDEFDFVHVKRIALGVPEDKWDALFDEIYRVMKPGAAFEMVEEDLFFPGKPVESDDDETDLASPLSRASSLKSAGGRSGVQMPAKPMDTISQVGESSIAATPTPGSAFPKAMSRPVSPDPPPRTSLSHEDGGDRASLADTTTPPGSPPGYVTLIPPHSRSAARPTLYVRTGQNGSTSTFATTSPPKHFAAFNGSAVSLLNSISDSADGHLFRRRRSSTHLTSATDVQPLSQAIHSAPHQSSSASLDGTSNGVKAPLPFLLRTPEQGPANPRDHSLLEYIYYETLSSRFINACPLSLLTTYLEYHFKDARTHPPLQFTFPPIPVKQETEIGSSTEDEDDDDSHKEASPVRSVSSRKSFSSNHRSAFSDENGELLEEHRWLSMQGLLHHSSPYISLDPSKSYAFTPAKKSSFTSKKGSDKGRKRRLSRLPNKTLNIDLRTLNLHLHLRAKEIVGCSESMWEWVQETQRAWKRERGAQPMNGRGRSLEIPHRHRPSSENTTPDHKARVLEMTREDFNQLLLNFEMDMQDQASLNNALKERFQWSVMDSAPPQNRRIFNMACEKYDKWSLQESNHVAQSFPSPYRPSRNSLHAPSSINVTAPSPDTPAPPQDGTGAAVNGRARSNSHTIPLNRNGSVTATDRPNASPSIAWAPSRSDTSAQFSAVPELAASSTLAPTQKLSRSISVFVAWKPEESFKAKP